MLEITSFRFRPFDVPLREPFGIAGGAQEVARNVLVEVQLADGSRGLGEAAPFPAVNGETQGQVLAALGEVERLVLGKDARRYRPLGRALAEALAGTPTALAAVEIALLDALSRSARLPLWSLFGGAGTELRTDITIPTGDLRHAKSSAERAVQQGFSTLKIKVGGGPLDRDVERIRGIFSVAPEVDLVLDANASLTSDEALWLLRELGAARPRVVLFEQPTAAEDREGLARVERDGRVLVAADESLRSRGDLAALIRQGGVSVVNVKTAKVGLVTAWDLLVSALTAGLEVMIGGMVESEVSMTTSACLAAGIGGVRFVDLDTPLFLGPRPLRGGFVQEGPRLDLSGVEHGHGVTTSVTFA